MHDADILVAPYCINSTTLPNFPSAYLKHDMLTPICQNEAITLFKHRWYIHVLEAARPV